MAIWCWVCLEVRKKILNPFFFAYSKAGAKEAAVLPSPVGAWAMRCCFASIADLTSSIMSDCIGLISSKGNKECSMVLGMGGVIYSLLSKI